MNSFFFPILSLGKHSPNGLHTNFIFPGFVVAASNDVDIYYYMDEAGNVLSDMPEWAPVPEWGVDIKCGKGTNFRYVCK